MEIDQKKIIIIRIVLIAAFMAVGVFFILQPSNKPIDKSNNVIANSTAPTNPIPEPTTTPTTGTVSAVNFKTATDLHQSCEAKSQAADKFDCYELAFKNYMSANVKSDGGKKTLQLLEDLQQLGGYALTNCHPLSHKVGNIAFHVYGSVLAAVPQYLPVCASGFYHGLLEEYLATAPNYYTGIKEVCGAPEGKDYFNWFQCTHGLGHGIMQHDDNEVPQSLKDCDTLEPVNSAREICYAGVFMENITTDEKTGHPAKYIKPENPIYPCDFVEAQYKSACYFLSSSQILKINGWNFQNAFDVCDTKAEEAYRWLCYESMGRDVSGSTLRSKSDVIRLCNLGAPAMRNECFFGAVRDFINDKGTFDTGIDLCNSIPSEYMNKCYSGVIMDLGLYKKGQPYIDVCNTMASTYKDQCIQQVKY